MEEECLKVSSEGLVAEIVVNRPKSLNALNADVLQSINLTIPKILKNEQIRAIIIRGEGEKAFVAGADIHSMSQLGPRAIADYVELGQRAMRCIEAARVPVIAAVNGYALGGGMELALACDIIIASKAAKFGQPEVNLGIIPGFGGTQRLIQRCGLGAARRLILSGEIISAEEASHIGLVDKLAEPADLITVAQQFAQTIAAKAPLAVRGAKDVLRASQEQSLLSGLRLEVEKFLELFGSVDREEGMNAFMQKREAKFVGK
ncbi:MAG: enoyl-CoA hydratase/isomerase family protein [Deltaproteobacteria bacterium]|nr:enoyl-CoA hydratase/isomerase family protein [Deltaproteobacteria bacterium]